MFASAWIRRRVGLWIATGLFPVLLGCDSAGYPDSGYGAAETVPPTKNCKDFCARSADCIVALCDENTSSTSYTVIHDVIDSECLASCTDAQLQAVATDASWQCFFDSSCRQVFENDVCKANARYSCR
jgi:hypothetical protein